MKSEQKDSAGPKLWLQNNSAEEKNQWKDFRSFKSLYMAPSVGEMSIMLNISNFL